MTGMTKKGKYHGLDVHFMFLCTKKKNKKCKYSFVLKNIWKVDFKTQRRKKSIILKQNLEKYIYMTCVQTGSGSCPMIEFGTSSKAKTQVIATLTYST